MQNVTSLPKKVFIVRAKERDEYVYLCYDYSSTYDSFSSYIGDALKFDSVEDAKSRWYGDTDSLKIYYENSLDWNSVEICEMMLRIVGSL